MKTLRKIETVLVTIPILLGLTNSRAHINPPKKKEYLGRIILSIAGFVMLSMGLIVIILFIFK